MQNHIDYKYQHLQIAMSPDAALGASGRISFKPIGGDIVPQVSDNDVWFWSLQRPAVKDSVTLLRGHTAGITCGLYIHLEVSTLFPYFV